MITATIVADSVNTALDSRLTTFLLIYPRFIHSELMTHRAFSRNASSSRAIPVERMIKNIRDNPAMPVEWGTTQKGMQAGPPLSSGEAIIAERIWRSGLDAATEIARELLNMGIHKQVANRVLEPWAHMMTLVSATEWGNFFKLRAHPDAQPEFQFLAYEMLNEYLVKEPKSIFPGDWHIPYHSPEMEELKLEQRLKVATARCARTSYQNFDGTSSVEDDIAMHDRLLQSGHFSPFEHAARAKYATDGKKWSGNFYGWTQYRELVEPTNQHHKLTIRELKYIYSLRPRHLGG